MRVEIINILGQEIITFLCGYQELENTKQYGMQVNSSGLYIARIRFKAIGISKNYFDKIRKEENRQQENQ